jgi:photosystem II stability/assembly factor-like uncharacterized protein
MKTSAAIIIILLFHLFPSSSFSQWFTLTSGTTEHLYSVYFTSPATGWAAGANGTILKTTNGGTNWFAQTGTSSWIESLFFLNSSTGYGTGSGGTIIYTVNGGTNWATLPSGSTTGFHSIYFANSFTGWVAGEFREIRRTTNGGLNWTAQFSSSGPWFSFYALSASTGFVTGWEGIIYKTTNSGVNWISVYSNAALSFYSLYFTSLTTGFVVGMGLPTPPIYKTTDAGNNWSLVPVPFGNSLYSVHFPSSLSGWGCGVDQIIFTSNGGLNWSYQTAGVPSSNFRSIFFANTTTGYAVGTLGTIIKTTNGGLTGFQQIQGKTPSSFNIYQNYPNPFNPSTRIKFDIPKQMFTKIIVYDLLGREIALLVSEVLKPGSYEVEFESKNYPGGVYFYKIITEVFSQTNKMVLIK